MRLTKQSDINRFLKVVKSCESPVWLMNENKGISYNLKSALSMYSGVAALIGPDAERYELFCDSKQDEGRFFQFFNENPECVA